MKERRKKMSERRYNLIDEPWIKVLTADDDIHEISLLELFRNAHQIKSLAGEIPAQDFAILRLLLAIIHSIFARYDIHGNLANISSPSEAINRWVELFDAREFPAHLIEKYLRHFEDRYYLIHPRFPFYQVAGMGDSTEYTAAKLNGELSESSNKLRLFPQRSGNGKQSMGYAEAARWLLYINGFDDTASKPRKKGLPSPGAGWLGKLGLIAAVGENLFETLLFNSVFLKDGDDKLWGKEKPLWEVEEPITTERREIAAPDNLSELYTLQSRRLLLMWDNDRVIGYKLLGGDFFQKENALVEQMTLWRNAAKKKTDPPEFTPRRHDPSRQIWRDFSLLVKSDVSHRKPGVVGWLSRLRAENYIRRVQFRFQIASVKYGDKDFMIEDVFGDSLIFNSELLTELGESWITRIIDEIKYTDSLVYHAGKLASDLERASGNSGESDKRSSTREQAYHLIDEPFRLWLESINPLEDIHRMDEICDRWFTEAKGIIRDLGNTVVGQAGPAAFVGRYSMDKATNKMKLFTSPEAYNQFLYRISSRETVFWKEVK
jgi:CRISPR system Cascade subunit CasA